MPSGFRVSFFKRSGGPPFGFSQVLKQVVPARTGFCPAACREFGNSLNFVPDYDVIISAFFVFFNPLKA